MRVFRHLISPTIRGTLGVVIYATVVTIVANAGALISLRLLTGPDATAFDYIRGVITASVLGPVLGTFGGWHLLRITRLSEELQRLLRRDMLTDAATRDHFFSVLAETPDRMGVVMMVDIDKFKEVNDTYGHLAGDRIVARTSKILLKETRTSDVVCRFGGDEFVVFLDDLTAEEAGDMAERIRLAVERDRALDGADQREGVSVTVSIGLSRPMTAAKIEAAIHEADQGLYRSKGRGRNTVSFGRSEAA